MKDLAPSPVLRKWFDHRPDRFAEFAKRYRSELEINPAVTEARKSFAKRRTTLLYAAHDPEVNHAIVLADVLRKS
jgi:uncharacterized protein YeaO (DUF488 family)